MTREGFAWPKVQVEVLQPADDMSDGEHYAVRAREVRTRLVLGDSVLPETIGEGFRDGTTGALEVGPDPELGSYLSTSVMMFMRNSPKSQQNMRDS